ncbi:MAG TPA: DUF2254 domain-containing protein [Streptosporangiaceae bacterium]|nr:DUF2254 domain-containing protein [Streptosporangiaceae bacterium]
MVEVQEFTMFRRIWSPALASHWRREVFRTNLWVVPAAEVVAAIALFVCTLILDRAAYRGAFTIPAWVISGTADAARQILTAIAAAVITVVGVVFSIILVTLTLASTQFGPRMLRNFIRDRGTQLTLGTFVATFVYAVLVVVSISPGPHGDFVPHIGVTVTLGLMVADLAILIYFIHHTAVSIQLPQVIASIANDLSEAIRVQGGGDGAAGNAGRRRSGPSSAEILSRMELGGGVVKAPASGYVQFIGHQNLIRLAAEADAVISLDCRPGHFIVQGHPFARVWPPEAARVVSEALGHAHVIGPYRTLTQDVSFGIDQLVEIAIRALSSAVNDTFTALTCIDWLGDNLCKIVSRWHPDRYHRDEEGFIRVIAAQPEYERLVQRSFEKIRQAGAGMPAIMIRQLDALALIMADTSSPGQRRVLLEQAAMIDRASERSVTEAADRADVRRRYEHVLTVDSRLAAAAIATAPDTSADRS